MNLTPLYQMFGNRSASEWYGGTLMGQTLIKDDALRRAYLDQGHSRIMMKRPIRIGIAYVRFSEYGRDRDIRMVTNVLTATRLLLDLEREAGRLDIKYVLIFVKSPDEVTFMHAPPTHIATTDVFED